MSASNTIDPQDRDFPGDTRAIEQLIASKILSPAARTMHIPQLATQHNGANGLGPDDQDDPYFMFSDRPLLDQVDRLIRAHIGG